MVSVQGRGGGRTSSQRGRQSRPNLAPGPTSTLTALQRPTTRIRPDAPRPAAPDPIPLASTPPSRPEYLPLDIDDQEQRLSQALSHAPKNRHHVHIRRCQRTLNPLHPAKGSSQNIQNNVLSWGPATPPDILTMTANGLQSQVLRWSALGLGVFYGAYHQLSLSAADRAKAAQKEWDHKQALIRQAKEQWARDHPTEQPKSSGGASFCCRFLSQNCHGTTTNYLLLTHETSQGRPKRPQCRSTRPPRHNRQISLVKEGFMFPTLAWT